MDSPCSLALLETLCELTERVELVVHQTNQVAILRVGRGELRILTLTLLDLTLAWKIIALCNRSDHCKNLRAVKLSRPTLRGGQIKQRDAFGMRKPCTRRAQSNRDRVVLVDS